MVGLGGRAALTSRGNSVKNLIKHGKRVAEVSVKLRNCGVDAYRHDVYGDSIIINRKLTLDNAGPRSYRICGADNHVISTKREELDTILDYFNIQVTHSCCNLQTTIGIGLTRNVVDSDQSNYSSYIIFSCPYFYPRNKYE